MAHRKEWTLVVSVTSGNCVRVLTRCNPLGGACCAVKGWQRGLGRQGSLALPLPGSAVGASPLQSPVILPVKRDNLLREQLAQQAGA